MYPGAASGGFEAQEDEEGMSSLTLKNAQVRRCHLFPLALIIIPSQLPGVPPVNFSIT